MPVSRYCEQPDYSCCGNYKSCCRRNILHDVRNIYSDPDNGEDADGFACKLTTGEGNVFSGCISYNNVDDGWDLYTKSATGAIGAVSIEDCVAYNNGVTSSGTSC